jgi:hypothetical protein
VLLALAACASLQADTGKGLAAAQSSVAAAVAGVHQAYVDGAISKATVVQAAELADQADDASKAARAAYAAGDVATGAGAVAAVSAFAAQILALEKPH